MEEQSDIIIRLVQPGDAAMLQSNCFVRNTVEETAARIDENRQGYAKGEMIPLAARIFSVVDVYDAVTSVRPYRQPLDHETAMALVAEGSGTQFDPDVVAAFVRLSMRDRRNQSV